MKKRFWPAAFAVLVAIAILDFLMRGVVLDPMYATLPQLVRPNINFPLLLLAYAIMAPLFTWIYAQGYKGGPPAVEGLRYGVVIGAFLWMSGAVIRYATEPIPLNLALYWLGLGIIEYAVLGVVVALVYGQPEGPWPAAQAGQAEDLGAAA